MIAGRIIGASALHCQVSSAASTRSLLPTKSSKVPASLTWVRTDGTHHVSHPSISHTTKNYNTAAPHTNPTHWAHHSHIPPRTAQIREDGKTDNPDMTHTASRASLHSISLAHAHNKSPLSSEHTFNILRQPTLHALRRNLTLPITRLSLNPTPPRRIRSTLHPRLLFGLFVSQNRKPVVVDANDLLFHTARVTGGLARGLSVDSSLFSENWDATPEDQRLSDSAGVNGDVSCEHGH
ncbi:hypothetical protein PSPO01_07968 [Paraphaeosphaeria sporulosa]